MEQITIIIPTLNEEKYLPLLLSDIQEQTYEKIQTIVVDGYSQDKTPTEATSFPNVKIIQTHSNVGHQRDLGAQNANTNILIFLDADTRLEKTTIEKIVHHFKKRNKDLACPFYLPYQSTFPITLIYIFFNSIFYLTQKISPSGAGSCIVIRNDAYKKYGGFKPDLTYDDIELIRRIAQKTAFAILPVKVYVSDRRFKKYGALKMFGLYLLLSLVFSFNQFKLANKIKYPFDIYRK